MAKSARPLGRPPTEAPKTAFRYSINYSADQNAEVEWAAGKVGDEFVGRYIGSRALEWARGVPIWVAPADPQFEAAVQARFPGYRVLSDARLEVGKQEIRIADGPVIPPSAHGIKVGLRQRGLQSLDKARK